MTKLWRMGLLIVACCALVGLMVVATPGTPGGSGSAVSPPAAASTPAPAPASKKVARPKGDHQVGPSAEGPKASFAFPVAEKRVATAESIARRHQGGTPSVAGPSARPKNLDAAQAALNSGLKLPNGPLVGQPPVATILPHGELQVGEGWSVPLPEGYVPGREEQESELLEESERAVRQKMDELGILFDNHVTAQYGDQIPPSSALKPLDELPPDQIRDEAAPGAATTPVNVRDYARTTGGATTCPSGGPPDVDIGVGVDWVITNYNSYFTVYNKSGVRQFGGMYQSIAASAGLSACGGTGFSTCDPQTLYDEENDRYILIWLAASSALDSRDCIAVTKTNDPRATGTANWWVYQYDPSGTATLDDYPHAGVGQDAIFIGVNRFVSGSYSSSVVIALDKTKAYNGTLTATDFKEAALGSDYTPQPAERRGYGQGQFPPTGTRHYIAAVSSTSGLDIWGWPTPTMSTTPSTYSTNTLASPGTPVNISGANFTNSPVDSLGGKYMDCEVRWPYLYTVRTGLDATTDDIQWAQINVSGGTPSVTNSGEYARATTSHSWMPDVTSDKLHNMAIAHNFANNTGPVFIGGYIAGRQFGDTANTMSDGGAVVAGGKLYNNGVTDSGGTMYRWGDYTGCAADPDGCTIWVTTEFVENNACSQSEATQLRNYKFSDCSVTNSLLLDDNRYTCTDTLTVTVSDITSHTAAYYNTQIGIHTTAGDDERIATANWVDISSGAGTKWRGTIPIASGAVSDYNGTVNVVHGDTITVTYTDTDASHPSPVRTATVDCSADLTDGGSLIYGGCDNNPVVVAPATAPEMYTSYMDAGEYPSYTFGIYNNEGFDLTDVHATLSVSGAGSSYVTIYNPSVVVGGIAQGTVSGATFNLKIASGTPNLTDVNMNLAVTSPADGLTTVTNLTQAQILEADDVITTQHACWTHNSADMTTSTLSGYAANPWTQGANSLGETITTNSWYGSAINCGNATAQSYSTATNASKTTSNFASNAFQAVIGNVQPTLRGNAGNGRPYRYQWLQHNWARAIETDQNTSGVWGVFYNNEWNSSTAPTADQVYGFPISVAWYYHTVFDWDGTLTTADGLSAAGWDSTNTGTPDSLAGTDPANYIPITFSADPVNGVNGLATASSYFAFGHFHADAAIFGGSSTTKRDIGLDNDHLIYHEFYAGNDATACGAGSQVGQVSFDAFRYHNCPGGTATISVLDDNRAAPFTVTVTSSGGADSETVTMSGTAPYFTGTLALSSITGVGNNNGTLFCLASDDVLTATYTDTSPAGTSTATALFLCTSGDVVYTSKAQISDNGDNDGIADNNETVVMDITITNNMASALTNAKVTITSASSTIDCIPDNQALYGTIAAGASATNPTSDRFTFHVAPTVACTDWQNPPQATFVVMITGDGFYGSANLQTFTISLDLDTGGSGSYTYTQNFSTDPGWTTGVTADEDGTCTGYVNNFRYRPDGHAAGNGCYGAWSGTGGTITGTGTTTGLPTYDSSTLYSPVFTANGNVTLSQNVAYRTSATYTGCKVQSSVNGGAWTNLAFTTPAQVAITTNATYCYPGDNSPADSVWNSTAGQNWTATSTSTVTATNGQSIQFRWRIGIDSTGGSARAYAGFGVDDVSIGNLKQTLTCEPTRNTGLAACAGSGPPAVPADNVVTGTPLTLTKTAINVATVSWDSSCTNDTNYRLLWGNVNTLGMASNITTGTASSASCSLGTSGSAPGVTTPTLSAGQCFFCIIDAINGTEFGRHGNNSYGNEILLTGDTTFCSATTKNISATVCH